TAETLRKRHLLAERGADRIGQGGEKRRVEDPGRDRHDADPELGEVACDRERHADDAALRGRIGGLADLAVEGRDRGRVDDATPPPLVTSAGVKIARGPKAVAASAPAEAGRSRRARVAPAATRRSAVARPSPEAPPVTTAFTVRSSIDSSSARILADRVLSV